MKRSLRVAALCAVVAGCKSQSATQRIGPTGGTLSLGDEVTLTIPPGALDAEQEIAIAAGDQKLPAGLTALSPIYRLTPEGLQFKKPITASVRVQGAPTHAALYWSKWRRAGFDRLKATRAGDRLTARAMHFSEMVAVDPRGLACTLTLEEIASGQGTFGPNDLVFSGDFNRDGRSDVVTVGSTGIDLFSGLGPQAGLPEGTFGNPLKIGGAVLPRLFVAGDADLGGPADTLFVADDGGSVNVVSLGPNVPNALGSVQVSDGKESRPSALDAFLGGAFVSTLHLTDPQKNTVARIQVTAGKPTLMAPLPAPLGRGVVAADVDHDGTTDLIVGNPKGLTLIKDALGAAAPTVSFDLATMGLPVGYLGELAGGTTDGGASVDLFLFEENTGAILKTGFDADGNLVKPVSAPPVGAARRIHVEDLLATGPGGFVVPRAPAPTLGFLITPPEDADAATVQTLMAGPAADTVGVSVFGWEPAPVRAAGGALVTAGEGLGARPLREQRIAVTLTPRGLRVHRLNCPPPVVPPDLAMGTGADMTMGTGADLATGPGLTMRTQLDSLVTAVWDGKEFVGLGSKGQISRSADGITWSSGQSLPLGGDYQILACSPTTCVAMEPFRTSYSSMDKMNWTKAPDPPVSGGLDLCWDGNRFVMLSSRSEEDMMTKKIYRLILTSPDGVTWTPHRAVDPDGKPIYPDNERNLVCSGNRYAVAGAEAMTSPDAKVWTRQPGYAAVAPNGLEALAGSGMFYVGVSASQPPEVVTSPDGVTWTAAMTGATKGLFAVAWTGKQFVIGGRESEKQNDPGHYLPRVFVSADGKTWEPRTGQDHRDVRVIVSGTPRVVLVASNGVVMTMEH